MTVNDTRRIESQRGDADDPTTARVRSLLEEGLERQYYTAAAAVAGTADDCSVEVAIGQQSPTDETPVGLETPFDVASLTKPIVTTTILFRLLERGALTLTDELGEHVPALERRRRGEIPLWRLVTHTSGLQPYAYSDAWDGVDDALADLYDRQLFDRRIGDGYVYSCLNYVHLAEALRQVTGRSLADLAEDHVFEPAGMDGSSLGPYDDPDPGVVETYEHERGLGARRNAINDPIANAMNGESGNAGLFAPARDVARYAQAVLADADTSGGSRLLAAPTVDCLPVRRSGTDTAAQGYGWRVATALIPAPQWSDRSIGHTGFTGTSLWIDLERGRFACLLTNAVYEQVQLYRFRQRYHAIVGASFG
ncbi:serine hydrolase domain-containing protein [Natronorubrum texcoconense]|uniref:CubicO group peptidase, beta-lactamase class C family n=1 Tax=Natronorubrum texcoconense TaxID=1095776 RepID=A0A1G9D8U2_9EURY|nr:serine hydrolase domain-containing protein [Natronorubrum texcoconense]SDK60271.1 CubicO group peptidase, beta-lactamase class C family [Natronorubrum texcoconense]